MVTKEESAKCPYKKPCGVVPCELEDYGCPKDEEPSRIVTVPWGTTFPRYWPDTVSTNHYYHTVSTCDE
jgi:hypothetical protein